MGAADDKMRRPRGQGREGVSFTNEPGKEQRMDMDMDKEIAFIKTTIIAGLLVLLPILAVLAIIGFFMNTVISMVAPIAGRLPLHTFGGYVWAMLITVFLLVAAAFLAGLFVQLRIGQFTQERVEKFLIKWLPGYPMLKNLTRQLVGHEGTEFAPALVDLQGSGAWVLGLIVEEPAEGQCTVFVPSSPAVTLGQVYFLPGDRVKKLEARLVDVVNCLTQWGVESKKFFPTSPKKA